MDSLFFDDGSNPSINSQGLMGMGIPSINPAMNMNVNMDDWGAVGGNNNNNARYAQPTATSTSTIAAAQQQQRQLSGGLGLGFPASSPGPLPPHLQNGSAPTPLGTSTSSSDLFFVDPVSPSPFGVDSLDSTFNQNTTLPELDDSMGLGLGMGFGNPAIQQYGVNEPARKRARSDYVDVTAAYGNYMPNTPGNNVFSAHAHQQAQKPNEYALQPVNSQRSGDYVVPADDQFSLSSLMTFHNAQQKIDQYMHQYNGAPAPNTGNNPTGSTFGTPVTKNEPITPPTTTTTTAPTTTTSTRATKSTTGRGRKASAAAAAAAASSGMDDDSVGSGNARPSPHDDSDEEEEGGRSRGGADDGRKKKHRMTDRQRRAKIKEGMDQLKALVPLDTSQKADQATIVASSVQLVHSLKDEIAALKSKLETIEAKDKDAEARRDELSSNFNFFNMGKNRVGPGPASLVSPFASLMASLNGAGVAMWRLGLDGRLLEVNMVFEMISGFHSAEIVGKSPCAPPLRGTLSCIPSQYLRSFATLDAFTTHGQPNNNNSSNSSTAASSPNTPSTPPGQTATPNAADATSPTSPIPNEGQGALFGGANMHSLPHLPDSALRSFFPSKISHCEPEHISLPERVPSMHGVYLIHHLLNLPNNNVLKLLSRHATSYGDTLESIVTLCLVRGGPDGAPQYILSMNTPDSRRLLKTTRTTTL